MKYNELHLALRKLEYYDTGEQSGTLKSIKQASGLS